jgi:mitotic spindle assembly checkpoint protein MAD2
VIFRRTAHTTHFQRGLYEPDTFKRISKYGLTILVSSDQRLNAYISQVMSQLHKWLMSNDVEKLVLVICGSDSGQTLVRSIVFLFPVVYTGWWRTFCSF